MFIIGEYNTLKILLTHQKQPGAIFGRQNLDVALEDLEMDQDTEPFSKTLNM